MKKQFTTDNTTMLTIQREATLTSNGTHHHGCCKPILAVDIPKTFNSILDTAEYFGVHPNSIQRVLKGDQKAIRIYNRDENGKRIGRCIGTCRLTYAAHAPASMNDVMEVSRNAKEELNKANEKIAELERKAALWDAYQKEQEAIRKANEEHDKAIAKADARIARRERIVDRLRTELEAAEARLEQAKQERAALN